MGDLLPPVLIELKATGSELKAKVAEAKAEIAGLEDSTNARMKGMAVAGKTAALGLAGIAVAAIGAGAVAVKMASDFQESTTQIVTGAGESESNIDLVRKGILAMAGATGTMPEELSKGFYLIASAGYHGAQGLDVLKAAAEGAKVGGADMAVVANGLTTALTDYAIPASRSNAVTSALVQTVADGKMKMQDLANSLGMVMPKASALGVSFQDVTGALATMTSAGFSARRASMNLANTVMALGAPGKAASDALKGIGLSAQQVKNDLSTKGLAGTLELIEQHVGEKFPKGSVAAVTALKAITGGATGYGTTLALTGSHMAAFEANVKNIGGALHGQTKSVQGFATVQKDLSFQVDAAKATMTAWGISIGTALLPIVTKAMVFINTVGIPAVKALAASFVTNVLPVIKQVAAYVQSTVIPALMTLAGFIVGTLIPGVVGFAKFLYNAREPIAIIAGIITAVLLPALVKAGVEATISAVKQGVAWVTTSVAAVASTATQVAQFAIAGAKWIWLGVQAGIGAAQNVAAWVELQATANDGVVRQVAALAATGAKWVWSGVVAAGAAAVQVGAWIATGVAAMANAAVIAAAWLISMGPIVLVIAAVVALGIMIATHMSQIKAFIAGAWTWVKNATETVWNGIKTGLSTVWGWIKTAVIDYFNAYKLVITTAFNIVRAVVVDVWNGIQATISAVVNSIRAILAWFGGLGSLFAGWFGNVYTAVTGALTNAVTFVGGIPGKILAALGDVGSLLLGAGSAIIGGLLSGITSAFEKVKSFVGGIASWISSHKGPLSYDRTLLSPHGIAIMAGLNEGLLAGFGHVKSNVSGMAGQIASLVQVPGVAPMGGLATSAGSVAGGASSPSAPSSTPRPSMGGRNGPLLHIENYNEAHQPPQLVAADLAHMLRTA